MKIRPSALPMLRQCPCYESDGEGNEATEAGTDRHAALAELYHGNRDLVDLLPDDQRDAVEWACEYIQLKAPTSDHEIRFEHPLTWVDEEFNEVRGTPDAVCGNDLFDLKWRYRDYGPQMAMYALMRFQEADLPFVRVHVLYGATRSVKVYTITQEEAERTVKFIIAGARNPDRKPAPCDYCGWCAKAATCEALNEGVNAVIAGREDWSLPTFHSSEIDDPATMAQALTIARHLAKWCESVEYHAKEMAVKGGKTLPGFKLQERAGTAYVDDIETAFNSCGMPQQDFLRACTVKLGKLETAYATLHGMKAAPAKREIRKRLDEAGVLKQGQPSISLVKERATKGKD